MKDYFAFRDRPNIGNFPSFFNADYITTKRISKKFGHRCQELLYIWRDERVRIVLLTRTDFDLLASKILEKIKSNKNFVTGERKQSLKISKEYLHFCQKNLLKKRITELTDNEINNLYTKVCKYHKEFSFYNVPLWFILGDIFADYLIKSLDSYSNNPQEVFTILSKPTIPNYLHFYNTDLFNLKEKLTRNEDVDSLLEKMEDKYAWIPFDYVGPTIWTRKDFIEQTNEKIEKPKTLSKFKAKQVKLADKLNIPNHLRRLFIDFQITQVMSDEKKEFLTKAQIYWQTVLVPEISKRIEIPVELIRFMTQDEIRTALRLKKAPKNLSQRPLKSIFRQTSDGLEVLYGEKVDKLYKEFNPDDTDLREVSGRVASLGYAKGPAKILLSPKEIAKVKNGDILVATMTTPDYVIAMKKAAGIVTDEGGITSHAAIVSREFGIPCIVGTSIATKVFNDDDIVEIDTKNAVARKTMS